MRTTVTAALLAGAFTSARAEMAVTAATPVARVLQCLQRNAPPTLVVGELRIAAQGRDATTKNLTARLWVSREAGGVRAQLRVTAPPGITDARYLLIDRDPEDELYLYLPALGKVRRLTGVGPESEIAGTTVNLSDLRTIAQAVKSASVSLSGTVKLQGRDADALRFVPSVADSPWRRVIVSVDRATCAVLRVEFQDATGTARTYDADVASLRQSGRYWYAVKGVIRDLRRETTATLDLMDVETDRKLSAGLFDPKQFHKS